MMIMLMTTITATNDNDDEDGDDDVVDMGMMITTTDVANHIRSMFFTMPTMHRLRHNDLRGTMTILDKNRVNVDDRKRDKEKRK